LERNIFHRKTGNLYEWGHRKVGFFSRTHLARKAPFQPRRAALIAAMSIFSFPSSHRKHALLPSPPPQSRRSATRGRDLPKFPNLSSAHPHWLSCPPFTDDSFQYGPRLFLIFGSLL